MGVRTDVPFCQLTEKERDIVFHGPAEKKHILYHNPNTNVSVEMDFTYFNATYTVENTLSKVKDEKGMKRVEKFLHEGICPCCHGTRLSDKARVPLLQGISLDKACEMTLSELIEWVAAVPSSLPEEMRPMAERIVELGPEAGAKGGNVIAQGTVADVCANPASRIGVFLKRAMEERRG